ncbi:hydrolase TatD [Taibaiella sp. KBW10]|uniref:TatD family hydrolase n=1 Tax=Taibaiella sp. KBW10 TaxID=2153357 RepID=UPI000F5A7245|nr:TatD family hydrolase [Taibaiella sp. KBW10]RQO29712.1 hydrolase TatD [Taibaiella sp. KBW10]
MIDTHAHLYDEQFAEDIDTIIARSKAQGVTRVYLPNCDSTTIDGMMQLSQHHPDYCFPMMGIHPCYIKENYKDELAIVSQWLEKHRFAAIGEIGLDYYWDQTFIAEQKEAFRLQIDLALAQELPIVIHSRNATQDCIDIVREKQNGQLRGIFHCFGDDLAAAEQIIDLGFKLGIGGVVTFKNSSLPEVLQQVDLQHLVLETDAPYLAPVPYRGKRNESSYIPLIAHKIAEIKGMEVEAVAQITTQNALQLFK